MTNSLVFGLTLPEYSNVELAALNTALTYDSVGKDVHGFDKAVKDGLLTPDGVPVDKEALVSALALEIKGRMVLGTFI